MWSGRARLRICLPLSNRGVRGDVPPVFSVIVGCNVGGGFSYKGFPPLFFGFDLVLSEGVPPALCWGGFLRMVFCCWRRSR